MSSNFLAGLTACCSPQGTLIVGGAGRDPGPSNAPPTQKRTVVENHTSAADKKAGIGLIFESTRPGNTGLAVSSIPPGGPAHACGKIEVGDFLVAVNDHNVEAFDPQKIAPYILGPQGTEVKLTFRTRDGRNKKVVILSRDFSMQAST